MIRRPARRLGLNPIKTKPAQIEFIDENIDHPNRIVFVNPVLQALRKQRALTPVNALINRFMKPPSSVEEVYPTRAFLHSLGHEPTFAACQRSV